MKKVRILLGFVLAFGLMLAVSCGGEEEGNMEVGQLAQASWVWVNCATWTGYRQTIDNCWYSSDSFKQQQCQDYVCTAANCEGRGTCSGLLQSIVSGYGCYDAWTIYCNCTCQHLQWRP